MEFYSSHDPVMLKQLLTLESVGERLENGLTLLHLCCVSNEAYETFCERIDMKPVSPCNFNSIAGTISSSDVLKLSSSKVKDKNKPSLKKVQTKIQIVNEHQISSDKVTLDIHESDSINKDDCFKDSLLKLFDEGTKDSGLSDRIECFKILLAKGADTAIISKTGFSPLHLASYQV